MAEPSPSKAEGHKNAYQVVFLLLVILFIGGIFEDKGWGSNFSNGSDMNSEERQIGFFSRLFKAGNVDINAPIITKGLLSVRSVPGGSIIGTQTKRAIGIVKEGPLEAYGSRWWRMDFRESPDGWVNEDFITSNVSGYRASQIIPIVYGTLRPIGIVFSALLLLLVVYFVSKRNKAYRISEKKIDVITEQQEETDYTVHEELKNKRWEHIEELMSSHNINDWKQAIIEADIMLDEMLTKMQYDGTTIAEKLKNVEESDFITLSKAWEAHKVRNKIAHSGADFKFDKNEAGRVIELYRKVFKEFFYI
ncbi:MAG: hypothetical protein ACI9GH_000515 [Candidatus Paceibacteria bacterium]|jgi:hypothetical protein